MTDTAAVPLRRQVAAIFRALRGEHPVAATAGVLGTNRQRVYAIERRGEVALDTLDELGARMGVQWWLVATTGTDSIAVGTFGEHGIAWLADEVSDTTTTAAPALTAALTQPTPATPETE